MDDQLVLTIERLRDDLIEFRSALRKRYIAAQQVVAKELKSRASRLAETWMVEVAPSPEVSLAVESDYLADLNVHFQRLLSYSERATLRSKYDGELKGILADYNVRVIIPIKQTAKRLASNETLPIEAALLLAGDGEPEAPFVPTAFVGHSFANEDSEVVSAVVRTLERLGITVVTGKKPEANRISDKVKRLIDAQYFFVGVFTRREKVSGKAEWMPSLWIVDEKAYAVGKDKKLVLVKEEGVGSIGGIQGDYEHITFSRDRLHDMLVELLELFELEVQGFAG